MKVKSVEVEKNGAIGDPRLRHRDPSEDFFYLTTMMMKRTVALLLAAISCSNAFSTSPSVVVSRREATQQLSMKSDTADDCATTGRRSFLTTVAAVIPAIAYSNPVFASGGKLAESAFST